MKTSLSIFLALAASSVAAVAEPQGGGGGGTTPSAGAEKSQGAPPSASPGKVQNGATVPSDGARTNQPPAERMEGRDDKMQSGKEARDAKDGQDGKAAREARDGNDGGKPRAEQQRERGDSGAATKDDDKSRAAANPGAGDRKDKAVNLNDEQKSRVRTVFKSHKVSPAKVDVDVRVGIVVPRTVTLYDVPEDIVVIAPAYRSYRYFIVGNEVCIVDPATLEIVDVILLA